jgi:exopolysaccharide production protein ExoZ
LPRPAPKDSLAVKFALQQGPLGERGVCRQPEGSRVFPNIQIIRAAAVYLVVVRHVIDSWNNYTGTGFGYRIDVPGGFSTLFFLVSGFVLAESVTSRTVYPATFLMKRLVRIVPFYWCISLLVFASTLFGLKTFGLSSPGVDHLVKSLLFLPTFENGSVVSPILYVGWTLNFQVFLYVLFALALVPRRFIPQEIALFSFIGLVFLASHLVDNLELSYFSSEILLVFYLGVLTSWIARSFPEFMARRTLNFFAGCLVGGSFLLVGLVLFLRGPLLRHHHLVVGCAAALVVFGATGLERKGCSATGRRMLLLGAASYSIFLLHPLVIQVTGKAMILTGLNATIPGTLAGYVGTLLIVGITGVAGYRYLEQPLHQRLTSVLLKPAATGQALAGRA